MSEKFTKGPWHWELTDGPLDPPQLEGNIEYSDCNPILMCAGCSPSCMREINKPCPLVPSTEDQNLIAAAPDMYEALECACDKYCIGYAGDSLVKCENCVIRKALCKARGETE